MDAGLFGAIALVEHCENPDQFERGFSDDERNQPECQRRLCITIFDVEIRFLLRDDATCEIDSNCMLASPLRVDLLYSEP